MSLSAEGDCGYVLAVDGGNSKTIALVAGLGGKIHGAGRAGCGDIYAAESPEAAINEIEHAVSVATRAAGVPLTDVERAVFSLAGADWPEDFELLTDALAARGMPPRSTVLNDAFGALRAGSSDWTGVAVVVGTGAATGARAPDGRMWHSSWWQEPQGSRQLAGKAVSAVFRSALGIEPPTSLAGHALALFGAETERDLLYLLTARSARPRPDLTPLTKALVREAGAGDSAAQRILRTHGRELGDYALAAARQVGLAGRSFPLVLAGGVFRAGAELLRASLCARVAEFEANAVPLPLRYEPAVGTLLLALEEAGVTIGARIEERIQATQPAAVLFEV